MIPLPPKELQVRVGSTDEQGFLQIGHDVTALFADIYHKHAGAAPPRAMLDFGCGAARSARWWPAIWPGVFLQGTDLHAPSIAWCKAHLPGNSIFAVNHEDPPLPRSVDTQTKAEWGPGVAGQFDLAVGLSVWTHMPLPRARAWMGEISRVLAPGGLFLATFLGPMFWRLNRYTEAQVKALLEAGSHYVGPNGPDVLGLRYLDVLFLSTEVARAEFGAVFEIVEEVQNEVVMQDLFVMRRRAT